MAANPCVVGWRADEHYADENFGDPDRKLAAGGNLPLNSTSLVWCDRAVASLFLTEAGKPALPDEKKLPNSPLWRSRRLLVEQPARICGSAKVGVGCLSLKPQLVDWEEC
jgi:hypothetical protein